MTRTGHVLGGEYNGKRIKVTSTGIKDVYGKVIWRSEDGKYWDMEMTKHFGRTEYFLHETFAPEK